MKRKVKIKAHTYLAEIADPRKPGETKMVRKIGRQGDEIEVSEAESERGDSLNAFFIDQDGDGPETAGGDGGDTIDFAEAGEDEIQEWIEEDEPTVKETVAAADGDPDVARRILAAEEATGDARSGVVKGLGAIIGRDQ